MKARRVESGYVVRLERGDEIHESLRRFVFDERIQGGVITAFGAAEKAVLGRYDLRGHVYHDTTLLGELEVGSVTGTVAWKDDRPALHLHAVVADEQLRAFAGHLHELRVNPLLEVVIREFHDRFTRTFDPATGLNLLDV
jgi:uncharacterized protein